MEDNMTWIEHYEDGVDIYRTCAWSPPGCHAVGCGVRLFVKDDQLIKVEGDPTHPISQGRLCARCLALKEYVYHPDRVLYPMKRAKENRGLDKWERISWDEALDLIEEKVSYIKQNWGYESIVVFSGTGREPVMYAPAMAFSALQTPHCTLALSGISCYGPRKATSNYVTGAGYPEMDFAQYWPDRYDDPRYEVPKYIVIWGKDPLNCNADSFFGHSIIDLARRGAKYICIDPRLTWTASRAEIHLQLRPGTDAAIALGMINLIIQEDLYDHEFVETYCYGFEELAERAAAFTPEKVEELTWVPKEVFVRAARAIGTNHPCALLWGLAIDQTPNAIPTGQAIVDLFAITGNLDVPGGNCLSATRMYDFPFNVWRNKGFKELPEDAQSKRICDSKYVPFYQSQVEAHPDGVLSHMDESEENSDVYPIMMAWFFASNVLNCPGSQPQRWYHHFMKMEFNVAQDCFMNPTIMGVCDLVLPASTYAEHDGMVFPHQGSNTHFWGAINKAITVGEAKSDLEICFLVGKRLNPKAWDYDSISDFYTAQIRTTKNLDFEDIQNMVVFQQPFEYKKYEKGLLRADGEPGFNTPTGLLELVSSVFDNWGLDPIPNYQEPPFSAISRPDLAEEYPLTLVTGGRSILSFHSEHRQIKSLRGLRPDALIEIHPDTAAEFGIEDGDWVGVENMLGKCVYKATVRPTVDPRVVHAAHAWWYPEQEAEFPNLFGIWKSNINLLIPHDECGPFGYGAPLKTMLCKIYKVDSLDAFGNEVPPIVKEY